MMLRTSPHPRTRLPIFLSALCLSAMLAAPVSAQTGTVHELDPSQSFFTTGCTGPSMCLCPVLLGESLSGSLRVVPLLPPLGPIFEYTIEDVAITRIDAAGNVLTYTGGGTLVVDAILDSQTMVLDLLVNGALQVFETVGAAPLGGLVDAGLSVSVFTPINGCVYDGLTIVTTPIIVTDPIFVRGDSNQDGTVNVADAISVLLLLFGGVDGFPCDDAYDVNDDGNTDISDPITLLGILFGTTTASVPPPFPACGPDPTPDALTCDAFSMCP